MPPISEEKISGVAVHRADVLVAGHRPEALTAVRLRVPVDGILATQLRERLVRNRLDEVVVVRKVDEVAGD